MFPLVLNEGLWFKRRFLTGRPIGEAVLRYVLAFLFASVAGHRAYGDVGVVLNESLDESMDRITGTGHSAIYFSRICAESPIKLRMCRPGELGSVMSIYINIGEDQPFEWNIVPLNVYLYGVEDSRNRPIFGSYKVKHVLEERYREKYLSEYCASSACRTSGKAEWREMVAATLIRGVHIFVVDTSVEQDRELVAEFDDSANKNHFNGATHNCADFTREVINTYFPHAVNRDYVNDFGMTSPKAVARSFTHYALRHPELNFRVMHFPQVPGAIKRSSEVRAGTEQLFHSKKLLIPMIIFADHALPVVAGSYVFTGRFNPQHEFEKHPAAELGPENLTSPPRPPAAALPGERMRIVGTSSEWKKYRNAFDSIAEENKNVIQPRGISGFFKHLDHAGTASVDSDGAASMELSENGESTRVGVSASNALAPGSNAQLSYKLFLARTGTFLKSPKHRRETMLEFQQDWANLQRASAEIGAISATNTTPVKIAHGVIMQASGEE
ncbi:MAG: hypothetical protein WBL63_15470 [Candidatus Acidiferrum sp.]